MHDDLISRLRVSRLIDLIANWESCLRSMHEAADALEAMQADARRLTWLGNRGWEDLPYPDQWQGADWLRSAIDAAMNPPAGSAQR